MKRFFALTLLIFSLGFASAQGQNLYAGGSLGFVTVFGFVGVPLTAHFGVEDLFAPNFDLRTDATIYLTGSGFGLGVNALYSAPVSPQLEAYGGAGLRGIFGGGGSVFGLGFLGGAEYEIAPDVGLFGEARTDLYFGGGSVALFGLGVGVNFHF